MREDTPPQSPLLALPLELRQAIYAHLLPHGIHLTLLNEQPHLSTCVQPDPNHGQWGQERCDAASIMRPHSDPDPVWARRLQSTWGPHWECEEMVQGGHGLGFMRTCRAMYFDILDLALETSTLHITDVATLAYLIEVSSNEPVTPAIVPSYLASSLPSLYHLSITLRLSFGSCMDLECPEPEPSDESKWIMLGPFLTTTTLPKLRSLDIWLDHDHSSTWTMVPERILLQSLPANPSISTTVNLPYLLPSYESAARHFTPTSPAPTFTLNRRVRQRFFAVRSRSGNTTAMYKADFPLLLEQYEDIGLEEEDIVATERQMWESGRDVEAEVEILSGVRIQYDIPSDSDSGSEIGLDYLSSDSDDDEEDDGVGAADGEEDDSRSDGEKNDPRIDGEENDTRCDGEEKDIAKSEN